MKKVFIFHGTGSNSLDFWFPYIKQNLDTSEFFVEIPNLPHTDEPILKECMDYLDRFRFEDDTILVGHSSGCPLILSLLEHRQTRVARVILVAGFTHFLGNTSNPILQEEYKWKNIKKKSREFYFIHSLNDPWGCNEKEGENFLKHLGGTLILHSNEGHMGSFKFQQPYLEFPLLKSLIELPLKL